MFHQLKKLTSSFMQNLLQSSKRLTWNGKKFLLLYLKHQNSPKQAKHLFNHGVDRVQE